MAAVTFGDRLISRKCDPEWASHSRDIKPQDFYVWSYLKDNVYTCLTLAGHSPDIKPQDFYLWSYLKDNLYKNKPKTISELTTAISAKIWTISRKECIRVIDNFARRI